MKQQKGQILVVHPAVVSEHADPACLGNQSRRYGAEQGAHKPDSHKPVKIPLFPQTPGQRPQKPQSGRQNVPQEHALCRNRKTTVKIKVLDPNTVQQSSGQNQKIKETHRRHKPAFLQSRLILPFSPEHIDNFDFPDPADIEQPHHKKADGKKADRPQNRIGKQRPCQLITPAIVAQQHGGDELGTQHPQQDSHPDG